MFDRANQGLLSNWFWKIDKLSFLLVVLLLAFGLICVSTASTAVAERLYDNPNVFIKKQIFYSAGALVFFIFVSILSGHFYYKSAFHLYLLVAILTLSTIFFGMEIKGSKRWLSLNGFSLQPSEFLKITLAIFNAKILSNLVDVEDLQEKIFIYTASFFLCLFSIIILFLQPDIGMSCLVFCTWIAQLFVTGISFFVLIIPIILFIIGIGFAYFFFDHVHYRIDNYLSSITNSTEVYQLKQSIETFKSGGLFGVGAWQGKAKLHLPDSHTDFIFSVIGEEFGIIACILLIFSYLFLAIRAIRLSLGRQNLFNMILIVGLTSQFIAQAFINIGVNIRLLPAKGMTLPFISYGGSSIFANVLLFGIILTINKREYNPSIF